MRSLSAFVVMLMLAGLLSPAEIQAKDDSFAWAPVTDSDWAVTTDTALGIHSAAMIFEKVVADDVKLQQDEVYRTVYRRIRILNSEGRKWADVDAPLIALDQKVVAVQGRTILPDGTTIDLEKTAVHVTTVVRTKGVKIKLTTFSLPGVTDNCIIEYMIKYKFDGYISSWIIQQNIPLLSAELDWQFGIFTVDSFLEDFAHSVMTPNYLWLNTARDVKVTQLPSLKEPTHIKFEITGVPAFEPEPFSLPQDYLRSKLLMYYGTNQSPAAYWGEQAANVQDWAAEFCESNRRLKKVVATFASLPTEEDKITAAYNWLRDSIVNTSYDEVMKGTEVLEPKENQTVDDMFRHGYGSAMEITYAFWDMVREMNIDALVAKVMSREDDLFVTQAKYWQFDNTIAGVKAGDGTVRFLSPGHAFTTPEFVPWYLQGVTALVTGLDVNFVNVPFSPATLSVAVRSYSYEVHEDLSVAGRMQSGFTGHFGRGLRIDLHDEDSAQQIELMKKQVVDLLPGAEMDSITVSGVDSCAVPLRMNCHLAHEPASEQPGRVLLKPFEYLWDAANPFTAEVRQTNILFPFAYTVRESAQFTLPEGWTVEGLPRDSVFSNPTGTCSCQFVAFGNNFTVQRHFTVNNAFWYAEDYVTVQQLFKYRQALSETVVVIRR